MIKDLVKSAAISIHPLVQHYWKSQKKVKTEPYICVITPTFDKGLPAFQKLTEDLQQQTYGNFIHVAATNGNEPKTKKYIQKLRKKDKRFYYFPIKKEELVDYTSLLQNLGKRRKLALQRFKAKRFIFLDADFKLQDQSLFAKLFAADLFIRKDIYVLKIIHSGRIAEFPVDFDIANFSFSSRVAATQPYFTNLDPKFGRGNDYRYFIAINKPDNTAFLDIVSGIKDGNRQYIRATDVFHTEKNKDRVISVFGNSFSHDDSFAIKDVLESHLVGMGKKVTEFEDAFKTIIGFTQAVATNSCTNAFWLLFKTLKLGKKDEVIIPNTHFFGIRNVLELLDIRYRVVDVESDIPNISLISLRSAISEHTKAIIFLEFGGYPTNIQETRRYVASIGRTDILLILDAANSPFTMVGNSYSALSYDFALYSFDMNKIIVTGDGGMIMSNKRALMKKMKDLSYYGIVGKKTGFGKSTGEKASWWETTVAEPGLKMAMNNISAVLGLTQLSHRDEFLNIRAFIKDLYNDRFKKAVRDRLLSVPPTLSGVKNSGYLYWIRLKDQKTRDKLALFLRKKRIYTTVKYQPLLKTDHTPNSFEHFSRSLCLPFNQNLDEADVDYITDMVYAFFRRKI